MEIMLSHLGIGVAYDALDGLDIHAQRLHLRHITNSDSKQIIADACLKLMGGSISADEFIKMASAF